MTYQRSASSTVALSALAERVFELLDNPTFLGAHMEEPSVMVLGASMKYNLDEAEGRAVGSVIRMTGSILGLGLSVEEVVTERHPPLLKTWETRRTVRLLVIGPYRMAVRISPAGSGCSLNVRIDYNLPTRFPYRLLGRLLGGFYANWCVTKITAGAIAHFRSVQPTR
ncbi:SRPBCC family protein [Rhizobium rosettiformans]|uniref:SRPBCC family protein n=1 Tax=Rhizobium rosettiformans TaxID=1368430 RepID=UPI00285CD44C|nr:SRPBCC family protein [Rhizobium rosettiformans]MDR7031099.1 hypothetical protein [Rhizobium rosettiformans]MDR7067003.1 hypothetical protein [Rhizobium rosettiformans]